MSEGIHPASCTKEAPGSFYIPLKFFPFHRKRWVPSRTLSRPQESLGSLRIAFIIQFRLRRDRAQWRRVEGFILPLVKRTRDARSPFQQRGARIPPHTFRTPCPFKGRQGLKGKWRGQSHALSGETRSSFHSLLNIRVLLKRKEHIKEEWKDSSGCLRKRSARIPLQSFHIACPFIKGDTGAPSTSLSLSNALLEGTEHIKEKRRD